jgi:RNA 3'-terminal phosphate cyclase (ATP)
MLDGSKGEGGGQILRTALTLALLTGRPFQIVKIRANREKPGLRPQHLKAVEAAALLGEAEVTGASVGSRSLTFRPRPYAPRDLEIDIGTAGSTALVLQTLHLPLALRAEEDVRVTLTGGTFNTRAPSFPFLETTWRAHLAAIGLPVALTMPAAGFYPRGGGRLDAWIEPAQPKPWTRTDRGPLVRIRGLAGVTHLRPEIAERMRDRAEARLDAQGLAAEIALADWPGAGPGAAIALIAEHEHGVPATFVGLGERGKPAETVADEAVEELLAYLAVEEGAVDPHSADQILIPLALAPGRSEYTVTEVTDHLRTNAETIRAFLDRAIEIHEPTDDRPGGVVLA